MSKNSIKATSEFLLVHRFCPQIQVGDTEKARTFLVDNLPYFAEHEVRRGFKSMERIWQIAVGIPEDTIFLSKEFLDILLHVPPSVKSALLMVLFLQNMRTTPMKEALNDVIDNQKVLFETPSLDTLYETTHNLMTFHLAHGYDVDDITRESCEWLSQHIFGENCINCIDLLAETLSVTFMCGYRNEVMSCKTLSILLQNQHADGGFPIFAGGTSEFHSSLVCLWALTVSGYE
ncbi:MAG: hypothetical protein HXS44_00425 [Theionarchaea archaeon]|nr:hypothetical protein [Theionarchaea archaeon]